MQHEGIVREGDKVGKGLRGDGGVGERRGLIIYGTWQAMTLTLPSTRDWRVEQLLLKIEDAAINKG